MIRNAVFRARHGREVFRERYDMQLQEGEEYREVNFLTTAAPIEFEDASLALVVLEDITEVVELNKIIPICSICKRIRNDEQYWEDVVSYLGKHTRLHFSHGMCPACIAKYYPEFLKQ